MTEINLKSNIGFALGFSVFKSLQLITQMWIDRFCLNFYAAALLRCGYGRSAEATQRLKFTSVASLGLVSRGAATDGCHPIFTARPH